MKHEEIAQKLAELGFLRLDDRTMLFAMRNKTLPEPCKVVRTTIVDSIVREIDDKEPRILEEARQVPSLKGFVRAFYSPMPLELAIVVEFYQLPVPDPLSP